MAPPELTFPGCRWLLFLQSSQMGVQGVQRCADLGKPHSYAIFCLNTLCTPLHTPWGKPTKKGGNPPLGRSNMVLISS